MTSIKLDVDKNIQVQSVNYPRNLPHIFTLSAVIKPWIKLFGVKYCFTATCRQNLKNKPKI